MTSTPSPSLAESTGSQAAVDGGSGPVSGRTVTAWAAGVFAFALLGALLMFHQLWGDPVHRTLGAGAHRIDPVQSIWFLKSVPWMLLHGHDPLRSDAINYPTGVSLAWNTSTPSLALLMAPITMTVGATFSYALLITLAPAATAATGFLWLRRHVNFLPAAAAGGLLIGYSPFAVGHLHGHLHLVFAALIPLMLMLFEDILWRHPRPAVRSAIYLGVVAAVQIGISEELVVVVAIAVLLALVAYLLVDARAVAAAVRAALRPLGIALAVFLVLGAPLLIEQLVVGDFVRMHNAIWRATVSDYLTPSGNTILHGIGSGRVRLGGAEDGVYMGTILVVVVAAGIVMSARDRLMRSATVTLVVLVVLTLGDARLGGVNLPWHYLHDVPGLTALLPVRLSFAMWFVIAWMLARWIDRLSGVVRSGLPIHRSVAAIGVAAIVGGLLTLVPVSMPASTLPPLPKVLAHLPAGIPRGSPVLLLPPATPFDSMAMYFQQESDFAFVMPSGYAYRKGIVDGTLFAPQTALEGLSERPSRHSATALIAARAELARRHYRAVVVVRGLRLSGQEYTFATVLAGRPPDRTDDQTWLWVLPA